jgi:hypothetical protein
MNGLLVQSLIHNTVLILKNAAEFQIKQNDSIAA